MSRPQKHVCTESTVLNELIAIFFMNMHKLNVVYYEDRLEADTIKFILPEFVSYLGERGVRCVGNGRHICTPVLMNMSNITFQVLA